MPVSPPQEQPIVFAESLNLRSDKARYEPGEAVTLTVDQAPSGAQVRYSHLGNMISEEPLSGTTWTWTPPEEDFRGYLIEVRQNGEVISTVGVDVSSDWTRFPRYGFLSEFGEVPANERAAILDRLNRYHINGIQYYDWHNKHHFPLPVSNGQPASSWVDIIQRPIQFSTVEGYIEAGHERGMAAMQYNLLFGAWEDFQADGVSPEWMVYNDRNHSFHNQHELGPPFLSNLLLADPSHPDWQQYIFDKTQLVYDHLDFDGWHLDQLGDRGTVYDYEGYMIDLKQGFEDFLTELRQRFPEKDMALNAVDQFGQADILRAPVDFAYTEVWSRTQYQDLVDVILENEAFSNGQARTVLAAYMQYDRQEGTFNRPAVLLTDAVIFAHGGAHLELGEHMLSNEYFPSDKLAMGDTLQAQLRKYYDFLVAYQNLLRDGGSFTQAAVESGSEAVAFNAWPPVHGQVSVVSKSWGERQVLHLLNFAGTSTFLWRDNANAQTEPTVFKDLPLTFRSEQPVSAIWLASPDFQGGAPYAIDFTQEGNQVSLTLPYLQYWDMVVVEY